MVVPVYDVQPTRRTPVVTYALVAVNVSVFLATPMAGLVTWPGAEVSADCAQQLFLAEYAAVPRELSTGTALPTVNDLTRGCPVEPYTKVPWMSAMYAMFLHASRLHLLGNMVTLFVIGPGLEDRLGRLRFLLFYLLAGFAATYGYALTYNDQTQALLGASGAIAGVFGAYLVMNPHGRVWSLVTLVPMRLPAWVVLGYWIIFDNVLVQLSQEQGSVAVLAHIVGFFAGVAWGLGERRVRGGPRSVLLGRT
jgi:membrane associated rhomboid family serine protease